jgi:hypothetical protein
VYAALAINKRRKVKRKCWVKDWIKRCYQLGAYTQLIMELQLEDAQQFRNFTRMSAGNSAFVTLAGISMFF